jgi:hypothetical protein
MESSTTNDNRERYAARLVHLHKLVTGQQGN